MPLFRALIMIEIADRIFAVDPVLAVFTITTDPYIVHAAKTLTVLGPRAPLRAHHNPAPLSRSQVCALGAAALCGADRVSSIYRCLSQTVCPRLR
jgi:hypothetical protein